MKKYLEAKKIEWYLAMAVPAVLFASLHINSVREYALTSLMHCLH